MGAISSLFGYLLNALYTVFNNYGVAIMSIEEADKIILNKFSQRKEENGKQYTLENL